jgi:hypothetical protein
MKTYQFTVFFKTGQTKVNALCALNALMKAMVERSHLSDIFATHIVDEKGTRYEIDKSAILSIIKV